MRARHVPEEATVQHASISRGVFHEASTRTQLLGSRLFPERVVVRRKRSHAAMPRYDDRARRALSEVRHRVAAHAVEQRRCAAGIGSAARAYQHICQGQDGERRQRSTSSCALRSTLLCPQMFSPYFRSEAQQAPVTARQTNMVCRPPVCSLNARRCPSCSLNW